MHCEEESGVYFFTRGIKELIFRPFMPYLADTRIKPESLSYLGVLVTLPFVYFFAYNPWIALFFLLGQFVFDMLDGALARYLNKQSERGAFIDMVCDYLSFFIVFLTFGYYGMVDYFIGTVFLIVYIVLQAFVSFAVIKGIKLFPVIRAKLFVYLFFLIFLFSGYNFMNEFLIVITAYTFVTDFFIYRKIICSI